MENNENNNAQQEPQESQEPKVEQDAQMGNDDQQGSSSISDNDSGQHKVIAIIGYILPILFFIPLLSEEAKKNKFAMFHANQHLILLIASIALMVVNIIPILGQIIWFLGSIAIFIFAIMGIINSAGDKMKPMPIIGGYKILK